VIHRFKLYFGWSSQGKETPVWWLSATAQRHGREAWVAPQKEDFPQLFDNRRGEMIKTKFSRGAWRTATKAGRQVFEPSREDELSPQKRGSRYPNRTGQNHRRTA